MGLTNNLKLYCKSLGEAFRIREEANVFCRKHRDTGWVELNTIDTTRFVGYVDDEAEAVVARYKIIKPESGEETCKECLVILDQTPFYAESGGQLGDTGILITESGREIAVADTFKWNDMIVHKLVSSNAFPVSELHRPLTARIASNERDHTRRNHSATHLLQAALRKTLGYHVQQSGSRVSPESLRFDFTHFKALSAEQLAAIETQVNEWVLADFPVVSEIKDIDEAKEEGAMALFGEKYADRVRVISMGRVSRELCGGTHVVSTGRIGLFHIVNESSIAAGIRRIEALTE